MAYRMGMGPLFVDESRSDLARRLAELAADHIYLGTSSWKYVGWLGGIYTEGRYCTRGRFSRKKFDAECISEYAETFALVGGDFSFYQFPTSTFWHQLFSAAPTLKFLLKVPEDITVARWPAHPRYGHRAGQYNEHFLDAVLFQHAFLQPLAPHRDQIAAFVFEFGTFAQKEMSLEAFTVRLKSFLSELPDGWRYSVETRNSDYLTEPYFKTLAAFNVAHVFNAWTRMPPLSEQVGIPEAYTADFLVSRVLLTPGRTYEQAVRTFEPYDRLQEIDVDGRAAIANLIRTAKETSKTAFIAVNNRFEGNAPDTIRAIVSP